LVGVTLRSRLPASPAGGTRTTPRPRRRAADGGRS